MKYRFHSASKLHSRRLPVVWALSLPLLLALLPAGRLAGQESQFAAISQCQIAPVWSGHPVGFCLLTHGQRQFAAFYDDQRRMTVAARTLGRDDWQLVRLDEKVGWDSHNYVTMAVDAQENIHLSGNMHCVPLVYFRTETPLDITTFRRIDRMTGSAERRCTYPRFFEGPGGQLIFTYRDGGSGNGNQMYNVYDPATKTWRPLLAGPLTDGGGLINAYLNGPVLGPDGFFHLVWVWRDTPDCATNHDLSYARSRDLLHWQTSDGMPLVLPITLQTAPIVDPVPIGGGLINGNTHIGFDGHDRLVLSYHKFDPNGNTQIYNARRERAGWRIYTTSDWGYRWEFQGNGSIPFEIHIHPVRTEQTGNGRQLVQDYTHSRYGSGTWILDEDTLQIRGTLSRPPRYPAALRLVESDHPGVQVRWCQDSGEPGLAGVHYVLRWETLGTNRDRPHAGPPPAPSLLRVYAMKRQGN
ncbi:MAG: BNR repeat-containing protein [Sedimentisphaerales bacterium]|nr:BNR repeat-containing protein [Sedimentisphaerales bacterium]